MDFEETEEQGMIREMVRDFAEEVLSLLESIDWQEGEPESWPALAWP